MSEYVGHPYWWRWLEPRERVVRGCGQPHTGVCDAERAVRWSRPGAWIPPEYRDTASCDQRTCCPTGAAREEQGNG